MASKKILKKVLSFALVLIFVLSTFVIVMPTSTELIIFGIQLGFVKKPLRVGTVHIPSQQVIPTDFLTVSLFIRVSTSVTVYL